MPIFTPDFGELNIKGIIHISVLTTANPVAHLRTILLLAPHTILNGSPPLEFHLIFANGEINAQIATVELKLIVGDITSRKNM